MPNTNLGLILNQVTELFSWRGKVDFYNHVDKSNPNLLQNALILLKANKEGIFDDLLQESTEAIAIRLLQYRGKNAAEELQHLIKNIGHNVVIKVPQTTWLEWAHEIANQITSQRAVA